jgi:hypothetical protein
MTVLNQASVDLAVKEIKKELSDRVDLMKSPEDLQFLFSALEYARGGGKIPENIKTWVEMFERTVDGHISKYSSGQQSASRSEILRQTRIHLNDVIKIYSEEMANVMSAIRCYQRDNGIKSDENLNRFFQFAKVFAEEPKDDFGCRGDRKMWYFLLLSLCTDPDPKGNFEQRLRQYFGDLIKGGDKVEGNVLVSQFQEGSGLSDGLVNLSWWEEHGFPLLTAGAKKSEVFDAV